MGVRGVDIYLEVNTGTDETPVWTKVGGQRGATLSESSDTVDVTSKDSNGASEFEYGLYSWTISADGVHVRDEVGYDALKSAIRNKTKIKVRIKDGTDYEEGTALVTSRELEGPYDGEATYSIELQGSGAITASA